MAANDKTDGPSKAEFDQLKRYCAQLEANQKRLEKRIMAMDERLRNTTQVARTAQANIERISRRQ